jgi:hypothetical protein
MNTNGQIGATISWFVGFLTIVIILALFFFMGFGTMLIQQTIQGKPEVLLPDEEAFHKSEQQRQLFVLLESETEKKEMYYLFKDYIGIIKRYETFGAELRGNIPIEYNAIKTRKETPIRFGLDRQILDFGNCFELFIIDNELKNRDYGTGKSGPMDPLYYFNYPLEKTIEQKIRDPSVAFNLDLDYSFFFPENSFALIKYLPAKCPDINI